MFIENSLEKLVNGVVQPSKDTAVSSALLDDPAALVGIAVAALGVWLSHKFNNPYFDPGASVVIGLVLIGAVFLLARKKARLPGGERIDRNQIVPLRETVADDSVVGTVSPFSQHTVRAG